MSRLLVGVLVSLAVSASGAAAQTARDSATQQQLRLVLRMMAGGQEIHYSQHGTYTSDLKVLIDGVTNVTVDSGTKVVVHFATDRGWAAEISHASLPGQSCVLWFGKPDAAQPLKTRQHAYAANEEPGRIMCDFDPPSESVHGQLRSALRAVATAQEMHYKAHNTYSADVELLRTYPGCEIAAGVSVLIQHASSLGWSAESSHPALVEESCVYFMARPHTIGPVFTRKQKHPGHDFPGRAICDFDPLPTKR